MAKATKPTKASKVRAYQEKHPTASAVQVAKATGVDIAYIYAIRHSDKKPNVKVPKKVVKFMGVTMAKDDITNLTEEQTARLAHNMTQGRIRMTTPVTPPAPTTDNVNHPAHYKVGGIETIDFIEAKGLNYHLGNVVKYITRADSKGNREEDLLKARWYLNREIAKFSK